MTRYLRGCGIDPDACEDAASPQIPARMRYRPRRLRGCGVAPDTCEDAVSTQTPARMRRRPRYLRGCGIDPDACEDAASPQIPARMRYRPTWSPAKYEAAVKASGNEEGKSSCGRKQASHPGKTITIPKDGCRQRRGREGVVCCLRKQVQKKVLHCCLPRCTFGRRTTGLVHAPPSPLGSRVSASLPYCAQCPFREVAPFDHRLPQ